MRPAALFSHEWNLQGFDIGLLTLLIFIITLITHTQMNTIMTKGNIRKEIRKL